MYQDGVVVHTGMTPGAEQLAAIAAADARTRTSGSVHTCVHVTDAHEPDRLCAGRDNTDPFETRRARMRMQAAHQVTTCFDMHLPMLRREARKADVIIAIRPCADVLADLDGGVPSIDVLMIRDAMARGRTNARGQSARETMLVLVDPTNDTFPHMILVDRHGRLHRDQFDDWGVAGPGLLPLDTNPLRKESVQGNTGVSDIANRVPRP
jgi:hypothetical protein